MSGAVASGHPVGRRSARRRLVEHVRTPLVRDGYALAVNSAFTAAVGLVYWIVAAHAFSARAVGLNAALISGMMFVAGVSTLNLSNIFVRFLPEAGRQVRRFVLVSYAAATLVAALGASLLMLFADGTPAWMRVWFVVASVAWCLFVLQDAVLTALGRAVWVPVENAGFSLLKLGLLPLLALVAPLYGVFVSWTAGMVLMVLAVNAVIFGRLLRPDRQLQRRPGVLPRPRDFARYFAADWVCALAWLASTTLLPVIVLAVAGATTNAYFSLAWAVAFPLYAIGHNIGTSLVLHGASDLPALPQLVRKAALQGGALLLACVVVLVALAPYALSLFGGDYADGATTLLRLLALAALPNLVLSLAVSVARVERRLRVAMIALGAQAALSLGSAPLLVETIGVSGAGVAWLGSQCIVAAGLLLLPLRRKLRVHRPSAILADVASGGWLRAARGARGARLVLGDTARSVRRIRTDSDLVVFRAATRGVPEVVVKLAWTPVGADRVAAHLAAVRSLRSLPGLGDWTSLLPDVLDVGAVRGRPYVVERALPGVDGRRFASDGRRDAAVAAAARSMRPLYDATSTDVLVDSGRLEALGARAGRPRQAWARGGRAGGVRGPAPRPRRRAARPARPRRHRARRPLARERPDGARCEQRHRHRRLGARVIRGPGRRGPGPPGAVDAIADVPGAARRGRRSADRRPRSALGDGARAARRLGHRRARAAAARMAPASVREARPVHAPSARPLDAPQRGPGPRGASGMSPPSLAVVICSYTERRWKDLLAAVESVEPQRLPPLRTIVVVDDDPALYERVREGSAEVTAVLKRGRQGLSAARNAGIAVTTEDVVAFLDDDAMAAPGWLARLVDPTRTRTSWGSAARSSRTSRPTAPPGSRASSSGSSAAATAACPASSPRCGTSSVRTCRSAATSSTRSVDSTACRAGRHSPTGCDETELCIRILERMPHGRLLYEPHAVVRHRVPALRACWPYFWRRCWAEGRSKAVVARAHGGPRALSSERAYTFGVLPSAFARALAEAAAGRDRAGVVRAGAIAGGLTATTAGYVAGAGRAGGGAREREPPARRHWYSAPRRTPAWSAATQRLAPILPLAIAVALWVESLGGVELGAMTDLGLVSVLPAEYFVALALLTVGFFAALFGRQAGERLPAVYTAALVVVLHATPAILYGTLRYPWAWKHVGIVDYIQRHGAVDPRADFLTAYHDWPGFFSLGALATEAAGEPTPSASGLGAAVLRAPLPRGRRPAGPHPLQRPPRRLDDRLAVRRRELGRPGLLRPTGAHLLPLPADPRDRAALVRRPPTHRVDAGPLRLGRWWRSPALRAGPREREASTGSDRSPSRPRALHRPRLGGHHHEPPAHAARPDPRDRRARVPPPHRPTRADPRARRDDRRLGDLHGAALPRRQPLLDRRLDRLAVRQRRRDAA